MIPTPTHICDEFMRNMFHYVLNIYDYQFQFLLLYFLFFPFVAIISMDDPFHIHLSDSFCSHWLFSLGTALQITMENDFMLEKSHHNSD